MEERYLYDNERKKMLLNKWVLMLIQHVKRQKFLYDVNHPSNHDNKERVWQDIAQKLKITVYLAKAKWKGLRDMYIRHLKVTLGRNKKYKGYRRWPWAKYMAFLKPHVDEHLIYGDDVVEPIENHSFKEEENSNDATDSKQSVEDSIENITVELSCEEETHGSNKKRIRLNSNRSEGFHGEDSDFKTDESLYSKENSHTRNSKQRRNNMDLAPDDTSFEYKSRDKGMQLDGLEHIFLGYAKTIKKLPMKNQIYVKLKIAKVIMEEELKCLE